MKTQNLYAFLKDAESRAVESGVSAIPVDSLRNRGSGRTPSKRALLARIDRRAREAGMSPVIANY